METELTKLITRDSRVCHFSGVVPLWVAQLKRKYNGNELAIYVYMLAAALHEEWEYRELDLDKLSWEERLAVKKETMAKIRISHSQLNSALGFDTQKDIAKLRKGGSVALIGKINGSCKETNSYRIMYNWYSLKKMLLAHPYLAVHIGTDKDKLQLATEIQEHIKLCTWSNFNGSIALAIQAECRLSCVELAIFLDLLIEHLSKCSYPVVFNWNIERDIKRYAVLLGRSTQYVSRSISKLEKHGLISKAERGVYTVQDSKVAAIYREWVSANTKLI